MRVPAVIHRCGRTSQEVGYPFGIQAGILPYDGPVTIRSSIVAGDYGVDLDYGSAVPITVSNSLIGDNTGSGLAEAPVGAPDASGNFVGGPVNGAIDPMLQLRRLGEIGDSHEDLQKSLRDLMGAEVALGRCPDFNCADHEGLASASKGGIVGPR